MAYCSYCGGTLPEGARFCPECGARAGRPVVTYEPETVYNEETGTRSTLQTVTGVFMIVSLVLPVLIMIGIVLLLAAAESMGADYTYYMMAFVVLLFYAFFPLVSLAWKIPMTVHYFRATRYGRGPGLGLKICSLIFVGLVTGILMFCDTAPSE